MRIQSIFAKILFWFVGTVILTLVAFMTTTFVIWPQNEQRLPNLPAQTMTLQLDDAIQAFEDGGMLKLEQRLSKYDDIFRGRHRLLDSRGVDLLSGEDRSDLIARVGKNTFVGPPIVDSGHLVFSHVNASKDYRFLVEIEPSTIFSGFFVYYLWIFLVIGLLCYLLAVQLASPLSALRRAVEQFGQGNFEARAATNRKDEIGELAVAFNRMADQIQTLLNAERRLLQDVSHELRSPLARMGFAVELARTSDDQAGSLNRIHKEVHRLTSLVNELLQLTRAEGDSQAKNLEELPLHDLLRNLVDDCVLEADARTCELKLEIQQQILSKGDPELLRRAIENVLRNAILHSEVGSTVAVKLDRIGEVARITIADHGGGVPPESLNSIFDPFFRVETDRNRSSGGVGLGLSIAKRAIELHQGKLSARNAEGGLVVMIELPILKTNENDLMSSLNGSHHG